MEKLCGVVDDWCSTTVSRGSYYTFVPATTSGSRNCTMGSGAQSQAVSALQTSLYYCHGITAVGTIDGIWGTNTTNGLRSFQSAHALTVDATYGPLTHNKMLWPASLNWANLNSCQMDTAV